MLSRKAPRSVLGDVSRPRRPRPRGKSVRNAKHTSTADEHTLKGDRPAEREDKQGTTEAHSMQRARRGGGGSPNLARWRNADARPNAPAPRGNAQFSPQWGLRSHCPSARGSGIAEAFLNRERQPQTPPRRARWGNDQVGTNTGMLLARSPIGRGAAGLRSFFSVVVFRETKVGQSQRGKAPPDPTEKKLLTHHQIARNRKRDAPKRSGG